MEEECKWKSIGNNTWERICKCQNKYPAEKEKHGYSACRYKRNTRKIKGGTEYVCMFGRGSDTTKKIKRMEGILIKALQLNMTS